MSFSLLTRNCCAKEIFLNWKCHNPTVGVRKMRGISRESKPGKIRNDDVSGTGPAGGKTSWRERYRNECTVGGSKYVRKRIYTDVAGGRSTGRP